jgi:hypothetical protein
VCSHHSLFDVSNFAVFPIRGIAPRIKTHHMDRSKLFDNSNFETYCMILKEPKEKKNEVLPS